VEYKALTEEYQGKTDDELLRLAFERAQLTAEAKTALNAELARRKINTKERLTALHHGEISCLDEVPSLARIAARQQFLTRWYKAVALAPFVVVLFVVLTFFPKSTSRIPILFVFASLAWATAIVGYSFFLMFAVKCPACRWRFGMSDRCMNCGLPRHRDGSSAIPLSVPNGN
jgi:hypothetical protein